MKRMSRKKKREVEQCKDLRLECASMAKDAKVLLCAPTKRKSAH